MRIVCPSCAAAYQVPEIKLSSGRAVRCARCAEEWAPVAQPALPPDRVFPRLPVPPAPAYLSGRAARPEAALTESETTLMPLRGQPERCGGILLQVGWVGSFAILATLACAAYGWRADITRVWPPSERVYAALGLTKPPQ
jgi:predicted Zn finger-like uncharacterized protein